MTPEINASVSSSGQEEIRYPDGSLHIMMLQRPKTGRRNVYHHHWRTRDGEWHYQALRFGGNRPKLVGDSNHNLFLISTSRDELRITRGTPNATRTSWSWSTVPLPQRHSCFGDALPDLERWEQDGILSIYTHEEPSRITPTKRPTPVSGTPSPLTVVDYRWAQP